MKKESRQSQNPSSQTPKTGLGVPPDMYPTCCSHSLAVQLASFSLPLWPEAPAAGGSSPLGDPWCLAWCLAMNSIQLGLVGRANASIIKCNSSSSLAGLGHLQEILHAKCLPSCNFPISTQHLSSQNLQAVRVTTLCWTFIHYYLIFTTTIRSVSSYLHCY